MKPVLLGMNNPYGGDPKYVLAPFPARSSGHRLWEMLNERCGAFRIDYMKRFERRNLLGTKTWSPTAARIAAVGLLGELQGREVVVLGREPADALGLPRQLVLPVNYLGVRWRQLPHPSGRNLWYNDPINRAIAGLLLEELYERSTP